MWWFGAWLLSWTKQTIQRPHIWGPFSPCKKNRKELVIKIITHRSIDLREWNDMYQEKQPVPLSLDGILNVEYHMHFLLTIKGSTEDTWNKPVEKEENECLGRLKHVVDSLPVSVDQVYVVGKTRHSVLDLPHGVLSCCSTRGHRLCILYLQVLFYQSALNWMCWVWYLRYDRAMFVHNLQSTSLFILSHWQLQ